MFPEEYFTKKVCSVNRYSWENPTSPPHTHTHTSIYMYISGYSLDEALCKKVCGMFRAVCRQVGHCVLHHNLEHGCCGLKLIPGGVRLQHLHYCSTNTPRVRCMYTFICTCTMCIRKCIEVYVHVHIEVLCIAWLCMIKPHVNIHVHTRTCTCTCTHLAS